MLQKAPKPQAWKLIKKGAKILFVAELVAFGVSYGVWHHMNTDSGETPSITLVLVVKVLGPQEQI